MAPLRRDDIDRFFDYSVHVPTRTIYVGGEVDHEMAEFFVKAMHMLVRVGSGQITVLTNNTGGDEYHGMAMYDAIATCHWPVTMVMYGHAMSMGSWIPQAADDRVMTPNCTMMLHYGSWGGYEMDSTHVATDAAENRRLTLNMEQCYLRRIREKHPKFSLAHLRKKISKELFLTAEDAVELGLADRIMEVWE